MKKLSGVILGAGLAILGSALSAAGEVNVGDTRESVIQVLGEPTGHAEANGLEAYSFERGRVLFRDGRVASHDLVSQEEADRQNREAERRREDRLEAGTELRDRTLEDPAFSDLPARERLAFWRAFQQTYPDVDTGLAPAMAAKQVEMEERQEMRELQFQLMEAEKAAELAQKYAPPHHPYYGSGFPLVFTDPLHTAFPSKFAVDSFRTPIGVRVPPPGPPTGRERFMPMQEFGHPAAFGTALHRQRMAPHLAHPFHHAKFHRGLHRAPHVKAPHHKPAHHPTRAHRW